MAYYFRAMDVSDKAYILRSGRIILELDTGEAHEIEGKNKVFGAGELLLNKDDKFNHYRTMSARGIGDESCLEIEDNKIEEIIRVYNAGFAITKDLAEISMWIGNISNEKNKKIGEKERTHREFCKILYKVGSTILHEYEQKKFHWLEPLYNRISGSIQYKEGEAYSKNDKDIPLSIETKEMGEFNKIFPPGATICEQGEMGYEVYILNSGTISVEIGGNEVAQINSPGTVIGEIALLLGQKRTATLKSVHNTNLTVIKNNDLKKVCTSQKTFLRNIAVTLARRIETQCSKVQELSEIIQKQQEKDHSIPEILTEDPTKTQLKDIKKELKAFYDRYDMEWIYDIYLDLSENMVKVKR